MTAEDELNQRQTAEDTRPTDAGMTFPNDAVRDEYIRLNQLVHDAFTTGSAGLVAQAEAPRREQLRRKQELWGRAFGDVVRHAAALSEAYRLNTDVEQLVVTELEALPEHPDDAELRATTRRIVAIVRHHNP